MPVSFIYGGVNNVFHLPQRLPHDVDVGDIQKVQLHIWVEGLTFVPSILGLYEEWSSEEEEKIAEEQERFYLPLLYLVGHGHAALSGIEDGELMRLSVGVHDDLEEAFILFAAAIGRSN